jgi:hypothetical protein
VFRAVPDLLRASRGGREEEKGLDDRSLVWRVLVLGFGGGGGPRAKLKGK